MNMEQYKQIPIIINNFNRLTITKKLFEDLNKMGYKNVYIIDNQSEYPELLEWYKKIQSNVIYLDRNYGQQALWYSGIAEDLAKSGYNRIIYTDPDIELNPKIPFDFVEDILKLSIKTDKKVGLALKIDDLPTNELCNKIKEIEGRYWVKKIQDDKLEIYDAPVDTTFCILDPSKPFTYEALRVAGDFTCRHIPWYKKFETLDPEELYIIDKSDPIVSTYKKQKLAQ